MKTIEKNQPKTRFFEMRTYIAYPGKINALHARFRDHTNTLFTKHGMKKIGYWTPIAGEKPNDRADRTLVYILAYPSRKACDASWKAFRADPEWIQAKTASETSGPLVEEVLSTFLEPTDYSPIQ